MANINNQFGSGDGYMKKMDAGLSGAISTWWNGLSKEEILDYLRDQPQVTADSLREMLANMNCALAFGVTFSTTTKGAITDFYTDETNQ